MRALMVGIIQFMFEETSFLGSIGHTVLMVSVTKEAKRGLGTAHISCRKSTPLDKEEEEEEAISIEMELPISPTVASRQLIAFTKETPLAGKVTISMSYDLPIVIKWQMESMGYVGFYLENAPKVDTDSKPVKSKEVIKIEEGSEFKVEPESKSEMVG